MGSVLSRGSGKNFQSALCEDAPYPPMFFLGATALGEGRYTFSEVYFAQALSAHPGRAAWDALMSATFALQTDPDDEEKGNTALPNLSNVGDAPLQCSRSDAGSTGSLHSQVSSLSSRGEHGTRGGPASTAPSRSSGTSVDEDEESEEEAQGTWMRSLSLVPYRLSPGGSTFGRVITVPRDRQLREIANFLCMTGDMALLYIQRRGCDVRAATLARLYSHFTCLHAQLMLRILDALVEQQPRTSAAVPVPPLQRDADSVPDGATRGSLKRSSAGNDGASMEGSRLPAVAMPPAITLLRQLCIHLWVSFTLSYVMLTLRSVSALGTSKVLMRRRRAVNARALEAVSAVRMYVKREKLSLRSPLLIEIITRCFAAAGDPLPHAVLKRKSDAKLPMTLRWPSVTMEGVFFPRGEVLSWTESALLPALPPVRVLLSAEEDAPATIPLPSTRNTLALLAPFLSTALPLYPGQSMYLMRHAFAAGPNPLTRNEKANFADVGALRERLRNSAIVEADPILLSFLCGEELFLLVIPLAVLCSDLSGRCGAAEETLRTSIFHVILSAYGGGSAEAESLRRGILRIASGGAIGRTQEAATDDLIDDGNSSTHRA